MYQTNLLKNKVAFIAGGTSGINLGIAKSLSKAGVSVAVLGRNASKADNAAIEIEAESGRPALAFSADVREPDQIEAALERAVNTLGKIDILVSGAAGNFLAPAVGVSPKGFKTVVDIDLLGTYNVFHMGFSHVNEGASLIAITAPQAVQPLPMQVHACAAKAGVNMLIKCLALEWGPAGIRVNGISPGPIDNTEGMNKLFPEGKARERTVMQTSLRRLGNTDDIANAVIYLSSELGNYVNGTILTVDGGCELGDASTDCISPAQGKRLSD